jgi:hypothetical protein
MSKKGLPHRSDESFIEEDRLIISYFIYNNAFERGD